MLSVSKRISFLEQEMTDVEVIKILKHIGKSIKKNKLSAIVASAVVSVVFAFNWSAISIYAFLRMIAEGERNLLIASPGVYGKVYSALSPYYSNVVSSIIFTVLFGFVIPTAVAVLFRLIFIILPVKYNNSVNNTSVREQFSRLCTERNYFHKSQVCNVAAFLPTVLFIINCILQFINFGSQNQTITNKEVIKAALLTLIVFIIASALLLLLFKAAYDIAVLGAVVPYELRLKLDEYWVKLDPMEKQIREEKREKELEVYNRKKEEKEKQPVVTFDSLGNSSSVQYTVFVDGVRTTNFYGGMNRSLTVSVGHHKVVVNSYDSITKADAVAATLDTDFEEYGRYTVNCI